MESYIPAIITASVALIAAVGAQLLAHYFQNKRTTKEKNNRAFQELIFPFLSEILLYYETETSFRKGHDVEKNVDVKDLIKRMSKKIQYSNLHLLVMYNELIKAEYLYIAKGDVEEINTLRFFYAYLSYSLEVLNKQDLKKEQELVDQIDKIKKQYGIWILVTEEIGYKHSTELMSFDFLISRNFLYNPVQDNLDELVYSYNIPTTTRKGYSYLKCLFEIMTKNDHFQSPAIKKLENKLIENSVFDY